MSRGATIRAKQGFYKPNGEAARTKPTLGQDPQPPKKVKPTRLVQAGQMFSRYLR